MAETAELVRTGGREVDKRSKLTPEVAKKLIDLARDRVPVQAAGPLAGIHPSTLNRYLAKGEQAAEIEDWDDPYLVFSIAFLKAQAEAQMGLAGEIHKMSHDTMQWTGLMTLGERLYPDIFGKKSEKQSINVNVGVQVGILEQRIADMGKKGTDVREIYSGG